MNKYISLIGLGVVGAPLANILFKKYGDDFVLLSSASFLSTLNDLYINGDSFKPSIISRKEQLERQINVVFICVKNYQIEKIAKLLKELIDKNTIIIPLQNGVYSFDYFRKCFPDNIVLEGFAQGPNTKVMKNIYVYQKPGSFHIGSSNNAWKNTAKDVVEMLTKAGVSAFYDDDIKHEVWKKLMLNVAGNAVTALTGIDYCMFDKSLEAQEICYKTMSEFVFVARKIGVNLSTRDIDDIIKYFKSFKVSKKTSMLEDVLNKRPTENRYIAGYVCELAKEFSVDVPHIDMLYQLMKIKEDVYLGNI